MKKLMIAMTVMLAATLVASGAKTNKKAKDSVEAESGEAAASAKAEDTVKIDVYPRLGRQATLPSPRISDASTIGRCYTGKPRNWIVLECKYSTLARCVERLTFTWHVVLETKTATNKDKEGQSKMAPYSYFTTTTSYVNIPRGSHCASVCLHPSYLERFGEPVAVSVVVADENGDILDGRTESTQKVFKGNSSSYKFWEDSKVMDAQNGSNGPMIERRQGLQDRSKTIWALVNPDDFELVQ